MARIRNTKQLGQRVDRTYLQKLYPILLWRRILTLVFVGAGLAWLGLYAVARNQTPYTAGPLAPSHILLGKRCAVCHGVNVGIGTKVADQQCSGCHDGPVHQASQSFTPPCISCHVEHRGAMQLTRTGSNGCASCHANLQKQSGALTVAANVRDFETHPEFAAVKRGQHTTGLRFNHQKHVGELSQKCGDCHVPAHVARPDPHTHLSSRALMSMPTYAGTCLPCHALAIDDRIPDAAPHDKPEVVHKFVVEQLTKYIAEHPADLGTEGTPRSAGAWVAFKVAADERMLKETCARCHAFVGRETELVSTVIMPTHAVSRRFTKASFDHAAHQGLICTSCHVKAGVSRVSSDVLLPGIVVCRQCHAAGTGNAGATCSTCHVYHDWSKEKPVDGKYIIEQMSRLLRPGGGGSL